MDSRQPLPPASTTAAGEGGSVGCCTGGGDCRCLLRFGFGGGCGAGNGCCSGGDAMP